MAAGYPQDLANLNNQAGALSTGLRDVLARIVTFKSEVDGITDASLEALGMSAGDVATLRSALIDMADLASVYQGGASTHLTGTYDYRTFAKQLWGFI